MATEDGRMEFSTADQIDRLPARVETLETIVENIPITYQTIDNANAQNAALVEVINSGAKNKLNVFAAPSQTQPINGVTWTVNSDGTVTANGTAYGNSWFYLTANPANITFPAETILTGCPEGGSASTWEIQCVQQGSSTRSDYGEGTTQPANYVYRYVACCVRSGQNVTNLKFKPMISYTAVSGITDDYVPYAPTNAELYQMLTSGTRSLSMSAAPQERTEEEER